jgi:hypothetical protein
MANSESTSPLANRSAARLAVFRRIDHVYAAAQHRHRIAAGGKRAFVRGGIDAACHAADDGESGARQVGGQPFGNRQAIGRGPPGADHGEVEGLQEFQASSGKQQNGRIEDLAQQGRIARVAARDHDGAAFGHFALLVEGILERAAAGDALGYRAANARRLQFTARGAEHGLRRAEPIQQLPRHPGTQPGDQGQRQPVQFLFTADRRHGGVRYESIHPNIS